MLPLELKIRDLHAKEQAGAIPARTLEDIPANYDPESFNSIIVLEGLRGRGRFLDMARDPRFGGDAGYTTTRVRPW